MESDDALRAELKAAIAKVSRQIEIQSGSRNFVASGPDGREGLVRELQAELVELQDALAGLGSEAPPEKQQSATHSDEGAFAENLDIGAGRGILAAMTRRRANPLAMGRTLLLVGSFGLALTATVGLAHFVFGVPVYESHTHEALKAPEVLGFLAILAGASGAFAAIGASLLRGGRRDALPTNLVR